MIEWECAVQDMYGNGSRSLFIRTVTVGFGITPKSADLAHLIYQRKQALVGYAFIQQLPPVGNLAPP